MVFGLSAHGFHLAESRESIEHDFAGVGEADRIKMTCTNAAKLYGFKVAQEAKTPAAVN